MHNNNFSVKSQDVIAYLKSVLSFDDLTNLSPHAIGKKCGACPDPLCGGEDRFYLNKKLKEVIAHIAPLKGQA
ncbi:MAG: hypothetical protein HQK62_14080 [Desulfamplus sp.]|nr:hypothetical protein [Desulfamplus sp.]